MALDSVGIYVPGGQAPYASSLLMNAIPAALAGVRRIVAVTPPAPDGSVHPVILAAASVCGITEIYRVGGAQAIGALAYGTKTVDPVRKIVGPGNAFVTEAKRLVFGAVGIDALAGPSEVAIVADDATDPRWIAADLMAQAEHDSDAFCVLISTSERILDEVDAELETQPQRLARQEIIRAALSNSLSIQTRGMDDTLEIVERIAPEHLQLLVDRPLEWVPRIQSAGVVLCGPYAPAPLCDYGIGPNHVLPTGGSARFASALGVDDFLRRVSVVLPSAEAFAAIQADCIRIANAESLAAHAASLRVRGGAR